MLIHNFPLAVHDEGVGNHLYAQSTFQSTIGVQQDSLKGPFVFAHQGSHLVHVLGLVDADGNQFHACFLLPVLVDFGNCRKLTIAGLAPGGKEIDDEGLAIIVQCVCLDGLAIDGLQTDGR